jgi:hypothetical protein
MTPEQEQRADYAVDKLLRDLAYIAPEVTIHVQAGVLKHLVERLKKEPPQHRNTIALCSTTCTRPRGHTGAHMRREAK